MRVANVNAVRELLVRGLFSMPTVRDVDKAIAELGERLEDPDVALFVDGEGFVIAELNHSSFVEACVVIHLFNGAHDAPTLGRLIRELEAFALEGGCRRIQGFDINDSGGFPRLMVRGREGWHPRALGVMYEFERA